MPIYAPSLPPRPEPGLGLPPALVLLRFDLKRILRQRLGRFFGFAFLLLLLVLCARLYIGHLLAARAGLASLRGAGPFLAEGPSFQAGLLNGLMLSVLWLQVALVGGGLVARDTLHRVRPLLYAHPVTHRDYLLAKGLLGAGLPFLVMAAYVLLPWGLSLAVAGAQGPVWPSAPLRLLPAAAVIALLMGASALGASSLAGSPRTGFGWVLGILLGSGALGGLLSTVLGDPRWQALGLGDLSQAWPRLAAGMEGGPGWVPALLGTALHIGLWGGIAARRTRAGEPAP